MTVGNVMVSTKRVMKKFSYGSVESPLSIESFFQIWWKFVQDFAASKEKLIELENERQKRIAKRKKQKNKEMKKKMYKQYGNKAPPSDESPTLHKGGSLYREFEKKKKFEAAKGALHGKLKGHVKQRSIFIANGGKVDDKNTNATMRRLSSMYQDEQSQVANALKKAREKAMLQYNKFKLPPVDKSQRSKWADYSNVDKFNSKNKNFKLKDDKPMMAPKTTRSRQQKPMPSSPKKKPMPSGGYKPQTASPKMGGKAMKKSNIKIKPKSNGGSFPPPPQQNGGYQQQQQQPNNGYHPPPPQQNGGYNPQNQWQQQQQQPMPGYGSATNLNYRQMQQMQQMGLQYNPNRMGAYQMNQQNPQQQQQQQNRYNNQQPKQYYNYPQKR